MEFDTNQTTQKILINLMEVTSLYLISPNELEIRGNGFSWRILPKYYNEIKPLLEQIARVQTGLE